MNPPDQMNRRHGYADLLRYPQRYQIDWRLWNGGTERILLWGDPEYVRRYDATTQLYDSPNWDVQEPLATKMEAQRPEMPPFALMPEKYRYYEYEFERYWHFYELWGRLGYNPDTSPELWQHEFAQRFGAAGADLTDGLHRASQVLPMIVAAVYPYRLFPTTRGWAERQSLGARLADYAKNEGTDTEQFENFADAAKRIAIGGATAKRTPEVTSRWFDTTANAIFAAVVSAEAKFAGTSPANPSVKQRNEFDSTVTDLRILAQLARFHARRAIAAVHYNLWLGHSSPAELAAAVSEERAAVAAWRDLMAAAGDRYAFDLAMGARDHDLCGHWRDELIKLEADLRDLEAQVKSQRSAPVDGKAWAPPDADPAVPQIEHARLTTARPGEALRIVVQAHDTAGVAAVRVHYRHVTQYEDYTVLDLPPTGEPDTFAVTLPGNAISPKWDFMYFVEAIDRAGHGALWPDAMKEAPYVIVKVEHP